MSDSEAAEPVAVILCRGFEFKIMPDTQPSAEHTYSIVQRDGDRKVKYYRVHANLPTAALVVEHFNLDLATWLERNPLLDKQLIFIRNDVGERRLRGNNEISMKLHHLMHSEQLCHPKAYDQVAILTKKGAKLIKAIFKAVECLHSRLDRHYGDLTSLRSYNVREITWIDTNGRPNVDFDVVLVPGHYASSNNLWHREQVDEEEERPGIYSRLEYHQELDIIQLKMFLFDTLLQLPAQPGQYFTNYQERVTIAPRLHKSLLDLKECIRTCPTQAVDVFYDTKGKGQFYHHYAIMDSTARLMVINDIHTDFCNGLPPILGTPGPNPTEMCWKERIMEVSALERFYKEPRNPSVVDVSHQPPDYDNEITGLLFFVKHVFTHIAEKQYAPEFNNNPDYLELVLAEIFHGYYSRFF